jgi:hypothetical protein
MLSIGSFQDRFSPARRPTVTQIPARRQGRRFVTAVRGTLNVAAMIGCGAIGVGVLELLQERCRWPEVVFAIVVVPENARENAGRTARAWRAPGGTPAA